MNNTQSDPADQLLELLKNLHRKAKSPLGSNNIANTRLFEAFEPLAQSVGYAGYSEFLIDFLSLCERVENGIRDLELRKETVRERMLSQIEMIRKVFDASNFSQTTNAVFSKHFSKEAMSSLDDISERFQDGDIIQTSKDEISSASKLAEELFEKFDGKGRGDRFHRLLCFHINHLKYCVDHYDLVGESEFWNSYKIIFATFMQLYPEEINQKDGGLAKGLRKMHDFMTRATNLPSNVATIGGTAIGLIAG